MNAINDLLRITQQIGDIAESNSHFTKGLARRIEETGKQPDELTISELITLIEQYREFYNNSLSESMGNDLVNTKLPPSKQISLSEILVRQNCERGFDPIPLESDLLIKRVKDGGYSSQFLADAFISSYRTKTQFSHSLGGILKLDAEAQRLFHQILYIRFIPGWSDQILYDIEQKIKIILTEGENMEVAQ
jgi:hypothetical protein